EIGVVLDAEAEAARGAALLRAAGWTAAGIARPARLAAFVDLAAIVFAALVGIAQEIVSGGRFLELRFDLLVARIEIRMQFLGELAVRALDLLVARAPV